MRKIHNIEQDFEKWDRWLIIKFTIIDNLFKNVNNDNGLNCTIQYNKIDLFHQLISAISYITL